MVFYVPYVNYMSDKLIRSLQQSASLMQVSLSVHSFMFSGPLHFPSFQPSHYSPYILSFSTVPYFTSIILPSPQYYALSCPPTLPILVISFLISLPLHLLLFSSPIYTRQPHIPTIVSAQPTTSSAMR